MSLCISSCTSIHSASCLEAFVWVVSSGFSKPLEQKYFFINAPFNFKCVDASWMLLQYGFKQQKKYIISETTRFQVLLLSNFIAGVHNLTITS